jgi:gas vesicle protein|tara:strand:+ start:1543 stop:2082 length:540 start_codon:yes stop_codon:yes gene_type:complete
MAEVEYKGIKFGGSKLLFIFPLLGTLGGGLWAGFEFYKDYMNMRSKIQKYTAPDLSGFDKKLAVLRQDMKNLRELEAVIKESASDARDYARDIKNDLKNEIVRTEKLVENVDRRTKTVQDEVRAMVDKENDRNGTLRDRINSRMDSLDDSLSSKMKTLEEETNAKIRKALNNPLSNMRK